MEFAIACNNPCESQGYRYCVTDSKKCDGNQRHSSQGNCVLKPPALLVTGQVPVTRPPLGPNSRHINPHSNSY
jgi:hypothetical protein